MTRFQEWKAGGRVGPIRVNQIPGYEEISDIYYLENGMCFGKGGRRVRGWWSRDPRYPYLSKDFMLKLGGRIHKRMCRLIARAFVDGWTPLKNEVDHIDGNKQNDAPSNLEWVTHAENMRRVHADNKQMVFCFEAEERPGNE